MFEESPPLGIAQLIPYDERARSGQGPRIRSHSDLSGRPSIIKRYNSDRKEKEGVSIPLVPGLNKEMLEDTRSAY